MCVQPSHTLSSSADAPLEALLWQPPLQLSPIELASLEENVVLLEEGVTILRKDIVVVFLGNVLLQISAEKDVCMQHVLVNSI